MRPATPLSGGQGPGSRLPVSSLTPGARRPTRGRSSLTGSGRSGLALPEPPSFGDATATEPWSGGVFRVRRWRRDAWSLHGPLGPGDANFPGATARGPHSSPEGSGKVAAQKANDWERGAGGRARLLPQRWALRPGQRAASCSLGRPPRSPPGPGMRGAPRRTEARRGSAPALGGRRGPADSFQEPLSHEKLVPRGAVPRRFPLPGATRGRSPRLGDPAARRSSSCGGRPLATPGSSERGWGDLAHPRCPEPHSGPFLPCPKGA